MTIILSLCRFVDKFRILHFKVTNRNAQFQICMQFIIFHKQSLNLISYNIHAQILYLAYLRAKQILFQSLHVTGHRIYNNLYSEYLYITHLKFVVRYDTRALENHRG
jgi:hypothetical protein